MGLTVAIYNTKENLLDEYSIDVNLLDVDEVTGEVYIKDDSVINTINFSNTIIEKNLGNISHINMLQNELKKYLKEDSIIINKILYDGSHCGDIINISELQLVKNEIDYVKTVLPNDDNVETIQFLSTLNNLVEIADNYKKPIVFI